MAKANKANASNAKADKGTANKANTNKATATATAPCSEARVAATAAIILPFPTVPEIIRVGMLWNGTCGDGSA